MTFFVGIHIPIVAFGKTNEHTGVTTGATEGSKTFTFNNSSNTIAVDDHAFCSDQSDANIQYLGRVTASSATAISTKIALQTTPGTSLKIWEATTFVDFQDGYAVGGLTPTFDSGTRTVITRGGNSFAMQSRDKATQLALRMDPATPTDYDEWETFITDDRTAGTKTFSLGYWDEAKELSKVIEVRAIMGGNSFAMVNSAWGAFTLNFFIETLDTYVAS